MEMSIGDVVDRASITYLKAKRIGNEDCKMEWKIFEAELDELKEKYSNLNVNEFFDKMVDINGKIWDLEAFVRQGKLDNNLEEIGRRTIQIREVNKKRIDLKNKINKITRTGFIDYRKEHTSM